MTAPASTLPPGLLATWLPRAIDAHAIVAVTDAAGVIRYANDAFTQLSGYSREELVGKTHALIKSGEHPPEFYSQMWGTIRRGEVWHGTFCNRAKAGHLYWVDSTILPVPGDDGTPAYFIALRTDITARHAAEDDLRRSESRWRTYLTHASEILYALTPELRYKFVSPAWTAKLGHPTEEVLGRSVFDFVHPDDATTCRSFIEGILAGRPNTAMVEYRMRHQDGRWLWHATTGSAYTDRDRRRAFFGVGRDISLRRSAQDELRAALARREEMERIVDRSPSVVILWRAEGGNWPVEFVSQGIRQFGYRPEDLISQRIRFIDITHPDDRERVTAEVAAHESAQHREYNQEYRLVCADGSVRWVDDHTVVRYDAEGRMTHHEGLITDITSRKLAEDDARAARERDLRVAQEVQRHLLPQEFPSITELDIAAHYETPLSLGGDYYDVIPTGPRQWGFVIADVSGKGAAAALMMASCRAMLRLLAPGESDPSTVLRRLNAALQPDMPEGMYISLFYAVLDLDSHRMRYSRAGHEPPLVIRRGGERTELLEAGGLALGLCPGSIFDDALDGGEVTLEAGDLVALYTDGINEACNANGVEFGRDRLAATLSRDVRRPLPEIVAMLARYLRQFSTLSTRSDDRTLLLLRMR